MELITIVDGFLSILIIALYILTIFLTLKSITFSINLTEVKKDAPIIETWWATAVCLTIVAIINGWLVIFI